MKAQLMILCCMVGLSACDRRTDGVGNSTPEARAADRTANPSVMGLVFDLKPGEVDAYVPEYPRYLRIRADSAYDLLLDETALADTSDDFMSVLPVQYGHGSAQIIAGQTIWCVPRPSFYRCGTTLDFRERKIVLLWREKPRSPAAVSASVKAARAFLTDRLTADRPGEASLSGAKMRGRKP